MSNHESQIQFTGYEVLKFHFDQSTSGGKSGWNFYPEVRIASLEDNILRGEVLLSVNAVCELKKGKLCSVSVLLRGFFQSVNVTQEEFKQYCLVKGSAHLVPPLRALVNDFLERVGNVSHDPL